MRKESIVLVAVLVVAVIGVWFLYSGPGEATRLQAAWAPPFTASVPPIRSNEIHLSAQAPVALTTISPINLMPYLEKLFVNGRQINVLVESLQGNTLVLNVDGNRQLVTSGGTGILGPVLVYAFVTSDRIDLKFTYNVKSDDGYSELLATDTAPNVIVYE